MLLLICYLYIYICTNYYTTNQEQVNHKSTVVVDDEPWAPPPRGLFC